MRLVPNQSSKKISDLFANYIKQLAPGTVDVRVNYHHGGEPVVVSMNSKAYQAAAKSMEQTMGRQPYPVRGGGSIPIVSLFSQKLSKDIVLMGFGLDSDALHSPNEHFGLVNYFTGIETIALFYVNYQNFK
jgi:acetylornithine deacetylase/succinyl-diaminopimelate desuccinylase-like protein